MKRNNSTLLTLLIIAVIALMYFFYRDFWPKTPDTARRVSVDSARAQVRRYMSLLDTTRRDTAQLNAGKIRTFFYSAEFFSKKNLQAILSESGCDGIRIYHAINRNGRGTLLILGVRGNNDMLPDTTNRAAATVYDAGYYVVDAEDENLRCERNCDKADLGKTPQ